MEFSEAYDNGKLFSSCVIVFVKVANSLAPQEGADIKGNVGESLNITRLSYNIIKEYVAVDDDISTALILTDNKILEIVHNPNDSSYVDSDDESDNGINDAVPVPSTSEMQKMIKDMHIYLDVHSNGEMNKTMDDLELFVDNMVLKQKLQKKISDFFPKKQ